MDEEASVTVEALEIVTDTTYTEEELAGYKALFNKFDHDGSETIEPSELGNALRYLGCNPLDAEVEAMITEADGKSNDNGKLEFSEFCEIIAKNRKSLEQEEEELRNAFRVFTKNDDGTIDRDEVKKLVKAWEMAEEDWDEIFDKAAGAADASNISIDELVRSMVDNPFVTLETCPGGPLPPPSDV